MSLHQLFDVYTPELENNEETGNLKFLMRSTLGQIVLIYTVPEDKIVAMGKAWREGQRAVTVHRGPRKLPKIIIVRPASKPLGLEVNKPIKEGELS